MRQSGQRRGVEKLEAPRPEYTLPVTEASTRQQPAESWPEAAPRPRHADSDQQGEPSTSGRDHAAYTRDNWLRDTGGRLQGSRVQLRLTAGSMWIELPIHLPRSRGQAPPLLPQLSADSPQAAATWEAALLRQLLSEPETQALLAAAKQELALGTVLRWSRAKHGDQAVTEQCLRAHLQWRADFAPGGSISEAAVQQELDAQKVFLQGCDDQGRAVVVVLANRHKTRTRCFEETLRLIVYTLDAAVLASDLSKNPDAQLLVLFDLSGLQMANLDVKVLSAIFDLVQNHYPEHLAALWFMNAPFIFRTVWRSVRAFLQPSTRDKIQFLNAGQARAQLQACVPLQVLPHQYGGEAELIPVDEAARLERHKSVLAEGKQRAAAAKRSQETLSSRAMGAGRAAKRWSGAAWAFAKRHNPAGAAAGLRLPKLSFGGKKWTTPKWPQMRQQMRRSLSLRLPYRQSQGTQTYSLRAGGKVLAAIPELLADLLRRLSVGAVQAISWLGRRLGMQQQRPALPRKQLAFDVHVNELAPKRHASTPSLVDLERSTAQEPLEQMRNRRRSESDARARSQLAFSEAAEGSQTGDVVV